jgi:hypothetical protein
MNSTRHGVNNTDAGAFGSQALVIRDFYYPGIIDLNLFTSIVN